MASVRITDLRGSARKHAEAMLALGKTGAKVRKAQRPSDGRSDLEVAFARQLRSMSVPRPVGQHRFAEGRGWRFDFAWPEQRLAVEVDGGTWSAGRHIRGAGFEEDCRKVNCAVELGWAVLRVTGAMVESGEAVQQVRRILDEKRSTRK